jgi:uncharacterized protein
MSTIQFIYNFITEKKIDNFLDLFYSLQEFVKEKTKNFDISHGIEHALEVVKNVIIIITDDFNYLNQNDIKILIITAMLHDVVDSKYLDLSITQDELDNYIKKIDLNNYDTIREIILNVSYSTEKKYPGKIIHNQILLNIVRDADRIESLGEIGIQRCYQYNKFKLGYKNKTDLDAQQIYHWDTKLHSLMNYIVTPKGIKLAQKEYNIMKNFIFELKENETNYISQTTTCANSDIEDD